MEGYSGTESNVPLAAKSLKTVLNVMVQIISKSIVAKDVSFFKTGPNLASSEF